MQRNDVFLDVDVPQVEERFHKLHLQLTIPRDRNREIDQLDGETINQHSFFANHQLLSMKVDEETRSASRVDTNLTLQACKYYFHLIHNLLFHPKIHFHPPDHKRFRVEEE